uniref:Lipocalin n=1 Tax=Rhipicephalus appendiculatus TaxID=34631 RepID=A0A131YU51_RHIAP
MNTVGLLVLHFFVCAVMAQPGANPATNISDTPLGRNESVYLVGYSAGLNNSEITCLHSNYNASYGTWVERYIWFDIGEESDEDQAGRYGIPSNMTILKTSPNVLTLNVSGFLKRFTEAESSYQIKYCDNQSILLAQNVSPNRKPWCSLWVTKDKIETQLTANETFYKDCDDPHYVGFPKSCF